MEGVGPQSLVNNGFMFLSFLTVNIPKTSVYSYVIKLWNANATYCKILRNVYIALFHKFQFNTVKLFFFFTFAKTSAP